MLPLAVYLLPLVVLSVWIFCSCFSWVSDVCLVLNFQGSFFLSLSYSLDLLHSCFPYCPIPDSSWAWTHGTCPPSLSQTMQRNRKGQLSNPDQQILSRLPRSQNWVWKSSARLSPKPSWWPFFMSLKRPCAWGSSPPPIPVLTQQPFQSNTSIDCNVLSCKGP